MIILLVAIFTFMLLAGDWLIKYASTIEKPLIPLLLAAAIWSLSIPGWYYVIKNERMVIVGLLFGLMSIAGTTLIGMIAFKERLSISEWIGLALTVVATILLTKRG